MANFQESCDWADSQEQAILAFYKRHFPKIQHVLTIPKIKCDYQDKGIDRIVCMSDYRLVKVEEKVRAKWYDDLFFEIWSCKEKGTPGWADKLLKCDKLLYCCPEQDKYKIYDYPKLKKAWDDNRDQWIETYKTRETKNEYTSEGCCVPISVIDSIVNMAIENKETK